MLNLMSHELSLILKQKIIVCIIIDEKHVIILLAKVEHHLHQTFLHIIVLKQKNIQKLCFSSIINIVSAILLLCLIYDNLLS